jgi:ribonuclease Z
MDIILLGTGSPLPDAHRAGPATLVRADGATLLVDAGRAVAMRLMAAGVPAGVLDAVLITHLHSDHITDLGDIITTRWITSFAPSPLRVIGPVGTAAMVSALLESLAPDISYRLAHHDDLDWVPPVEVTEVDLTGVDPAADPRVVFELGGVVVRAGATDHRPVEPSIGFRVDDGTASVVLAGDTVPCPSLDRLAADAGALVHTVIRKDLIEPVGIERLRDILDYHSSPEEAAATAQRAGVRTLVLTHYVPAPGPGELQAWFDLAATAFDGEVTGGDDLHTVAVPPTQR